MLGNAIWGKKKKNNTHTYKKQISNFIILKARSPKQKGNSLPLSQNSKN